MVILPQVHSQHNTQIRRNLWQTPEGAVVGYGAMLAPGGFYFCFTCNASDCSHIKASDEAWMKGEDSAEIPFDGSMPAGSGDESSEAARLGLPVEW